MIQKFVLPREAEIEVRCSWFDGLFGPTAKQRRAHELIGLDIEEDPGVNAGLLVLAGEIPDDNGFTSEDEDPMGFSD